MSDVKLDEAALLPCPFCGGRGELMTRLPRRTAGDEFAVRCRGKKCGAEGYWKDSEAEAIAAWNRRTPDPTLTAEVERLREALRAIEKRIETAVGGGTVEITPPPAGWPMTQSASQSSLLLSVLETTRHALTGAPNAK